MLVISPIGATNQSTLSNGEKIGLNEHKDILKVNAASTVKVKKWYKHWYKHWYKSNGKWKYTWRYTWKYYWKSKTSTVKAASSYSSPRYKSSKANTFNDPKLNKIMKSGAKYGYSHRASTASAMQQNGAGDCWAMSSYLNNQFQAAGYQSRVVQYSTSYSSRHRSVQLYQDGQWKTVPYRAYGYNYLFV